MVLSIFGSSTTVTEVNSGKNSSPCLSTQSDIVVLCHFWFTIFTQFRIDCYCSRTRSCWQRIFIWLKLDVNSLLSYIFFSSFSWLIIMPSQWLFISLPLPRYTHCNSSFLGKLNNTIIWQMCIFVLPLLRIPKIAKSKVNIFYYSISWMIWHDIQPSRNSFNNLRSECMEENVHIHWYTVR